MDDFRELGQQLTSTTLQALQPGAILGQDARQRNKVRHLPRGVLIGTWKLSPSTIRRPYAVWASIDKWKRVHRRIVAEDTDGYALPGQRTGAANHRDVDYLPSYKGLSDNEVKRMIFSQLGEQAPSRLPSPPGAMPSAMQGGLAEQPPQEGSNLNSLQSMASEALERTSPTLPSPASSPASDSPVGTPALMLGSQTLLERRNWERVDYLHCPSCRLSKCALATPYHWWSTFLAPKLQDLLAEGSKMGGVASESGWEGCSIKHCRGCIGESCYGVDIIDVIQWFSRQLLPSPCK